MSATVKLTRSDNRAVMSLNFTYHKDAISWLLLHDYIESEGQWLRLSDRTVAEISIRHVDRVD